MQTMTDYAAERLRAYGPQEVGCDFTMGNGHDTQLLSTLCTHVYAFDIQEEALRRTKDLLGDASNVTLILASHADMKRYVDAFDVGIFNLGYLPDGAHTLTTKTETTMIALKHAVDLMRKALIIVCYVGHEEGAIEAEAVTAYAAQLDRHRFNVSCYRMLNKDKAPFVIEIEKRALAK